MGSYLKQRSPSGESEALHRVRCNETLDFLKGSQDVFTAVMFRRDGVEDTPLKAPLLYFEVKVSLASRRAHQSVIFAEPHTCNTFLRSKGRDCGAWIYRPCL